MSRKSDIERICQAALDQHPESRAMFVAAACGGDDLLHHEVESLLSQESAAVGFTQVAPALKVLADGVIAESHAAIGQSIGGYFVVSRLGTGGMGEVYRARDSKLARNVALKVLPESFAKDPERLARFQREAKLLASLSHPNIGAIYGLEESKDVQALVLELVEGPTLTDRIAQGAIPIDETLRIAAQIALALEAAHEQGVIHRDLKPANIKLRPDGVVKVLDFGLAKAIEPVGARPASLSQSPKGSMTRTGIILGTASYMSPEQTRGQAADRRCDMWAFGCVLFEMLAGTQTFGATDFADAMAAVVKEEPDWSALPANTPPAIRRLLRRALTKALRDRLADASMARIEIAEALTELRQEPQWVGTLSPGPRAWIAWAIVAGLALALVTALAFLYLRPTADAPEMSLDIATPATSEPFSFAISPDGRKVVFVASDSRGPQRLWLRPLEEATARPLPGTDGARLPFWSPDSRSVAFFAASKLQRLDLETGLPRTIVANAGPGGGGSWGSNGVIVFAPFAQDRLMRVAASGGPTTPATAVDRPKQIGHRHPYFLPDGRRFLFFAGGSVEARGIYLGALDSPNTVRLTDADSAAAFVASGWLLFVRQGALVARKFEPSTGTISDDFINVVNFVPTDAPALGNAAFSVSAAGTVAYRSGTARNRLVWFDRTGKTLGTFGDEDGNGLAAPALSPDGTRVAVTRAVQGNADLWILDARGTTKFTFNSAIDQLPVWSSDGREIAFDSNRRAGVRDIYRKAATGAGTEELLVESAQNKAANSWSSDRRFLFFSSIDPKTQTDLWVLPIRGERKPFPFLNTPADERSAMISPDGRWVAYLSNESEQFEIYVRPFPPREGQWQVSNAGGIQPRWSRDGREVYYVAPDERLMAVPIAVSGATLQPGTPTPLFQTRIFGGGSNVASRQQYDVTRDGRFLVNTVSDDVGPPITLLLNWNPKSHNSFHRP